MYGVILCSRTSTNWTASGKAQAAEDGLPEAEYKNKIASKGRRRKASPVFDEDIVVEPSPERGRSLSQRSSRRSLDSSRSSRSSSSSLSLSSRSSRSSCRSSRRSSESRSLSQSRSRSVRRRLLSPALPTKASKSKAYHTGPSVKGKGRADNPAASKQSKKLPSHSSSQQQKKSREKSRSRSSSWSRPLEMGRTPSWARDPAPVVKEKQDLPSKSVTAPKQSKTSTQKVPRTPTPVPVEALTPSDESESEDDHAFKGTRSFRLKEALARSSSTRVPSSSSHVRQVYASSSKSAHSSKKLKTYGSSRSDSLGHIDLSWIPREEEDEEPASTIPFKVHTHLCYGILLTYPRAASCSR